MAETSLVLILLITFASAFPAKNQTSKIPYYSNGTESTLKSNYTALSCDLFSCDLTVATATLIYWPTPAPVPNVTSTVSNGFTL